MKISPFSASFDISSLCFLLSYKLTLFNHCVFLCQKPAVEGLHGWYVVLPLAGQNCSGTRKSWSSGTSIRFVITFSASCNYSCTDMSNFLESSKTRQISDKSDYMLFLAYTERLVSLLSAVLGELCGARTVSFAPDGLSLHGALHVFGRVRLEASGVLPANHVS